jgi:hypothetical protein
MNQPVFMVVIGIDNLQTERPGISGAFVFPLDIFLVWIDVGIAVVYDRSDSVLHEILYYCRRTRGAAGVQKDPALS